MSMLRYYMTPETRQAVIAESNRLIATRAAMNSRSRGESRDLAGLSEDDLLAAEARMDTEPSSVESAFARLVADLQSAAAASVDGRSGEPSARAAS
jgi:hypothetical protein